MPAEKVRKAVDAGIDAVGENRVQELLEKLSKSAYEGVPLHFIGSLQRNKVKYLIGKTALIHSVDSLKLAAEINLRAERANIVQDVLVQVNIADEPTKSGVAPENLCEFLKSVSEFNSVSVQGLMTIPPVADGGDKSREYFLKMKELFVDIGAKKYDNVIMRYLSMGMSGDFYEAILCGANIVRIGSAVFGDRA